MTRPRPDPIRPHPGPNLPHPGPILPHPEPNLPHPALNLPHPARDSPRASPTPPRSAPTLFRSTPDGFATLGWRRALLAHAIACAIPAAAGAVLQALLWTLGTQTWGDGWLLLWATAALLMLSPAFTWFGLALAAPLTALLMNRGWFGWLPAIALGTGIGAALGWLIGTPLALPFGTGLGLVLRATLTRLSPNAV